MRHFLGGAAVGAVFAIFHAAGWHNDDTGMSKLLGKFFSCFFYGALFGLAAWGLWP